VTKSQTSLNAPPIIKTRGNVRNDKILVFDKRNMIMKITRSFRRYSVFESAESIAHTDEGFVHVDTVVVDISRGGFNVKSDTYLPIGTPVLTMLPFFDTNGAEDVAVLTGKVSWSGWNDSFYSIGVILKDEIVPEYNQGLLNYYFRNGMQC
jgi:hypothetical protein